MPPQIKQKIITLLRWSEKYTKTDMVYLASGGFWLLLGQISTFLLGLITLFLFANYLPKHVYGQYTFVISVFAILSVTALSGTTTAFTAAVSRGNEGDYLKVIWEKIKWGCFGLVGGVVLSIYYFFQQNYLLSQALLIVSFFIPLTSTSVVFYGILIGRKDFRMSAVYTTLTKIVLVLFLALAIFFTDNLFVVLLASLLPVLIANFIIAYYVYQQYQPNKNIESGLVRYAKHLSLMGVLTELANHIDKVLVFHFIGSTELAIYFIATTVPERIRVLFKNVPTLLLPKFSKYSLFEIKENVLWKMSVFLAIMIMVIIVYVLLVPFIYEIFFPDFTESVYYSQIFALSLLGIVGMVPNTALQSQKQTRALYFINIINHSFTILVIFIGVYFWGILGIVIAKALAKIVEALLFTGILLYNKKV